MQGTGTQQGPQAFYIQIANAILPELTDLLNPFTFLISHGMAR